MSHKQPILSSHILHTSNPAFGPCLCSTHKHTQEEEDEGNEYEDDGFLVHEGEGGAAGEGEEDDDEGVAVKRKRKKRSKEVAHKLDEEDYDLLEENQVVVSVCASVCHRGRLAFWVQGCQEMSLVSHAVGCWLRDYW